MFKHQLKSIVVNTNSFKCTVYFPWKYYTVGKLCLYMCCILSLCPKFVSSNIQKGSFMFCYKTPYQQITMKPTGCTSNIVPLGFQFMLMKILSCSSPDFLCTVTRFNVHRDITISNQIICTVYSNISSDIHAIFLRPRTTPFCWVLYFEFDIYILSNAIYHPA